MMIFREIADTIQITILVKTRASMNSIEIQGDHILIKIKAVPVKGKANKQIIKFLSKEWKIKSSNLTIISGQTSTTKVISIRNSNNDYLSNKLYIY